MFHGNSEKYFLYGANSKKIQGICWLGVATAK